MLYNLNLGRKTSLFDVKRRILSGVFQEKACFCKEKESGNGFFSSGIRIFLGCCYAELLEENQLLLAPKASIDDRFEA